LIGFDDLIELEALVESQFIFNGYFDLAFESGLIKFNAFITLCNS
jgi:hypothetical protein